MLILLSKLSKEIMSNSNSSYASKTLTKLRERNEREVVPFVNLVTMNVELLNTNAQLNVEKEQLEFINAKLKEENEKMKSKSSEINYEQVSVLEKKLFSLQEELTELHRRRGEKAQQIIDQTAELKNYDTQVSELKEQIELNKVQAGEADKKIAKLKKQLEVLPRASKRWWSISKQLMRRNSAASFFPPLRDSHGNWLL